MTVRDIFLTYGQTYLDAFSQRMPSNHPVQDRGAGNDRMRL